MRFGYGLKQMSSSRDRILGRLRETAKDSSHPGLAVASKFQGTNLWDAFQTYLVALGGRIIERGELDSLLKKRCYIEPAAASILGIASSDDEIWDVEIGVTLADLAIAETGTLLVSAGAGKCRMASLAPPINVMLISKSSIVATISEAVEKIPTATSVFITGPSRTADIEGILVKGVHGPGELLVYSYE